MFISTENDIESHKSNKNDNLWYKAHQHTSKYIFKKAHVLQKYMSVGFPGPLRTAFELTSDLILGKLLHKRYMAVTS